MDFLLIQHVHTSCILHVKYLWVFISWGFRGGGWWWWWWWWQQALQQNWNWINKSKSRETSTVVHIISKPGMCVINMNTHITQTDRTWEIEKIIVQSFENGKRFWTKSNLTKLIGSEHKILLRRKFASR